jgi:hypothetical protein
VADPENPNLNLNHFLLLLLLLITTTRPNNNNKPKMLNLFGPHLGLLMSHLLLQLLFLTEVIKEVVAVLKKVQA